MKKKRTTVEVLPLLTWTNKQLARTDKDATVEFKSGIAVLLEKMLHAANRYNGFTFNNANWGTIIPLNSPEYWSRTYAF
jgi:hypothetical protein